jgi:hypothetical protein
VLYRLNKGKVINFSGPMPRHCWLLRDDVRGSRLGHFAMVMVTC